MTESSRRIVLAALGLGLVAMFALSVAWRTGDHPLVRQRPSSVAAVTGESSPATMEQTAETPETSAIMALMQKMKADPHDVETLLELARVFAEQGDTESAKDMVQRAVVAAPSDYRPPYLMGLLLARESRWEDAAAQLERSISLKDDAATRYSLAVIYRYHLKQEEKARANYETAAKICEDAALASMIKAELEK